MLGDGSFRTQLQSCNRLLRDLNLVAYFNQYPASGPKVVEKLRKAETYEELYRQYLALNAANMILNDGAILFFLRTPNQRTKLSYGYLECPYLVPTYAEFQAEFLGVSRPDSLEDWEDYEVVRSQSPRRSHVTPLRFDWSPTLYREGAHPAAHLHVGHQTDVRLAVDVIMEPIHFILMVLRQYYLSAWEDHGSSRDEVRSAAGKLSGCEVESTYVKGRDLLELRLRCVSK